MAKRSKNSAITLRRVFFWTACFALVTSFTIIIFEKEQVTDFYKKPVVVLHEPNSTEPTNVVDYPIKSNDSDASPDSKQSGTDRPVPSSTLSGTVNFKSINAGALVLRVTINQILDSGKCILTLTRSTDGKQVTKTASIIANPSSATCGGFDIPTSELGSGKWSININLESGNKTGVISDEVTI